MASLCLVLKPKENFVTKPCKFSSPVDQIESVEDNINTTHALVSTPLGFSFVRICSYSRGGIHSEVSRREDYCVIWRVLRANMGKRKSSKKPESRKQEKLSTVFSCPFCNHESSVECRMDRKDLIGEASCRICQESFSTSINSLSEPIDVYSEWIDECERVNNSG